MSDFSLELLRLGITVGITLLTFFLTWIVGQRIATRWAIRQKRKELQLSAANRFENIYGEFFSVWKLWDYYCKTLKENDSSKETYWNLLNRACAAEASVEALMVKLSSEFILTNEDIASLGKFRQAFQSLRESISRNEKLQWSFSEHSEYLTFKRLSTYIVNLLAARDHFDIPDAKRSFKTLREITHNKWEGKKNWVDKVTNFSHI